MKCTVAKRNLNQHWFANLVDKSAGLLLVYLEPDVNKILAPEMHIPDEVPQYRFTCFEGHWLEE